MIKYKKIYIPILKGIIHIFVSDDFKAVNHLYKLGISNETLETSAGIVDWHPRKLINYICLLEPNIQLLELTHEAVHLVNKIYLDRGIGLDRENDENQAYLTAWIFDKLHQTIK